MTGCDNPAIVTRGRLLTVAEIYFCDAIPELVVDRLHLMQTPEPLDGADCAEFHSWVVELRHEQDTLWRNIHKGSRYKIGRAERRDGVEYHKMEPSDASALNRFRDFFNRFGQLRGLPPVRSRWLTAGVASGAVELSLATDSSGRELVWHSYYRGVDRVRLLQSASTPVPAGDSGFSNLIGRANRFLHWQDMLHYKAQGMATFDMGGWYVGTEDRKQLGINAFKEQFGGRVVREFNCDLLLTTKARVVTRLLRSFAD